MDKRIKLAKKYFRPTAAPMQKHHHDCPVSTCKAKWEHVSTRCARRGHRNKICPKCMKRKEQNHE